MEKLNKGIKELQEFRNSEDYQNLKLYLKLKLTGVINELYLLRHEELVNKSKIKPNENKN